MPNTVPTDPDRPRRRGLLLFGLLGYGYILAVLSGLVAVAVLAISNASALGVIARLAVWIVAGMFWIVAAALIVRIAPPSGVELTRESAPGLFAVLDRIRNDLGTPPIHHVIAGHDLNASVVELRRFGVFGPWKRYLTIGFPLLEGLGPRAASAVLAHECAHLAIGHNRTHVWLTRLGVTWQRLMWSLEAGGHWGAAAFRAFFRWYVPRYQDALRRLSRADEFTSDAAAARAIGEQVVAAGLLQLHAADRLLRREFWWRVYAGSAREPEPPGEVFDSLATFLRGRWPEKETARAVRWVLDDRTRQDHTHPSLRDRLRALGVLLPDREDASIAPGLLEMDRDAPASDTFIAPDRLLTLRRAVAADWRTAIEPAWSRWVGDSEIAARTDSPPKEASLARARWAAACSPVEEAIAAVRASAAAYGTEVSVRLLLGRLLVAHDEPSSAEEGARLLESIIGLESIHSLEAADLLQEHYARRRDWAGVARCRDRSAELLDDYRRHSAERHRLSRTDRLGAWPVPEAVLAGLARRLGRQPEIERGYLIRKFTRRFRDEPLVYLALECRVPWYRSSEAVLSPIVARVAQGFELPGDPDLRVVGLEPRSLLLRRCRRLAGGLCYERGSPPPDRTGITDQPTEPPVLYHLVPGARGVVAAIVLLSFLVLVLTRIDSGGEPNSPEAYRNALPGLEARARAAPRSFAAQSRLGWAYLELERWEEATAPLERAAQIDSTAADIWNNLGWALEKRGLWNEAIPALQRAVTLDPGFGEAHLNLGWAYYETERDEEAIAAYVIGLEILPRYSGSHHTLGLSHLRLGQPARALSAFREASRVDPDDPDYLGGVAWAASQLHRYHEVRAAVKAVLRLDSTRAMAWGLLAESSYMTGREAEAGAAFLRAEGVEPEFFANHPRFVPLRDDLRAKGLMQGNPGPIALTEPKVTPQVRDSFRTQDSLNQALTEAQIGRLTAGSAIATRLTSIPSLRLRIGEELSLERLQVRAWDAGGKEVKNFAPAIRFEPEEFLTMAPSGALRTVQAGQGRVVVALSPQELSPRAINPRRVTIQIEVRP